MAIVFVDSNATGAADGTSWTDAFERIHDAVTDVGTVAGSTVYVSHNHSYIYTADANLTNAGTIAAPINIICVNTSTGEKANTAVEKTVDLSYYLNPITGNVIYDGVNFESGDFYNIVVDSTVIMRNLEIYFNNSSGGDSIMFQGDANIRWENVYYKAANTLSRITLGNAAHFEWVGGGISSDSVDFTQLFRTTGDKGGIVKLRDLDLSKVTTQVFLLQPLITSGLFDITLSGCKLPSGVPILNETDFTCPHKVRAISCDSADGFYYFEETYLEGQIKQATNCYLNFEYDGSNKCSAKMISNTNAIENQRNLRFKLAEFWSEENPTIVVETITDGVTLQNNEFWLEIEYPDDTDNALRNVDISSKQEIGWSGGSAPGTPANLTTSTASWTEDLSSEVKQKIEVEISGGAEGPHTVWCCLSKPSTTVYVDPEVNIS